MTRFFTVFILLSILFVTSVSAQTQKDTIYTFLSKTPVVIDGSDADECWSTATWHAIDKVWLPHITDVMEEGDFEGKFKVAWDANYLYILVEVKDDILSDDHTNPTDNYWNDDCVEIFIDENRSKGYHQTNNNAFAYHTSVFYDVIDNGLNLRNNLKMVMDTISENTYLWEFAVKMYDENLVYSNSEASRVTLTANKLMGFSIAYCDNDDAANKERENFIGSMIMDETHRNDNYITADYFGTMLLVDPDHTGTSNSELHLNKKKVAVYQNSSTDKIVLSQIPEQCDKLKLELYNIAGSLVRTMRVSGFQAEVEIGDLKKGVYLLNLTCGSFSQTERIIRK